MPPHVRMNLEAKLSGYAMRWIIRNHKLALLAFRLPLRNIAIPAVMAVRPEAWAVQRMHALNSAFSKRVFPFEK